MSQVKSIGKDIIKSKLKRDEYDTFQHQKEQGKRKAVLARDKS